jgi:hypothetical protein
MPPEPPRRRQAARLLTAGRPRAPPDRCQVAAGAPPSAGATPSGDVAAAGAHTVTRRRWSASISGGRMVRAVATLGVRAGRVEGHIDRPAGRVWRATRARLSSPRSSATTSANSTPCASAPASGLLLAPLPLQGQRRRRRRPRRPHRRRRTRRRARPHRRPGRAIHRSPTDLVDESGRRTSQAGGSGLSLRFGLKRGTSETDADVRRRRRVWRVDPLKRPTVRSLAVTYDVSGDAVERRVTAGGATPGPRAASWHTVKRVTKLVVHSVP